MKKTLVIITSLLIASTIFAVDYSSDFVSAFHAKDFKEAKTVLSKWEKAAPDNPEMLIAYFNYYLNRDLESTMTMGQMEDGRYGMFEQLQYNNKDVKKGISYLDKALKNNPSRLDIHFGKCSSLIKSKHYKEASNAIIDLLKTSVKVENKWLWTNNEPIVDNDITGEDHVFFGINDYLVSLFNNFEETHTYLSHIFNSIEQLYPNNIIGLNLNARYNALIGDTQTAKALLEKALKLDETDYIILANLGYYYELENDYEKARDLYERMLKLDNPEAQRYGEQYLSELEEKM